MKIYSWNINGIRAGVKKGLLEWMKQSQAETICLQETKAHPDQLGFDLLNVEDYMVEFASCSSKKGYSGVATYSRVQPSEIQIGLKNDKFDREGRTLIHHYPDFTLYNIYFPNGKASSERLAYKMEYYAYLLEHLKEVLKVNKNIVICGDVNTAHHEIDLARPKENEQISGFLSQERAWIDQLLELGFIDAFRHLHPQTTQAYTWWSQRSGARARNVGWRIDYFFVSQNLREKLKACEIHPQVTGSDHCPISLELEF
jgi:exodeoxyribonuclease-3